MKSRLNNIVFIIPSIFLFTANYSFVESATSELSANISLRLYLGDNTTDFNYLDVAVNEAAKLLNKLDPNKPTVFYIHGYNEHLNRDSVNAIVDAYLRRKDHNVVAVDWSQIALQNYLIAVNSVEDVGKTLAKGLNDMVRESLDPDRLHVVAHSLGGQVSGFIGRNLNFKLRRITALDPAGPGFNLLLQSLSYKDAKFVDVIHTDFGVYGVAKTSGTADFYPNGGTRIQPGCPNSFLLFSDEDFCSHHRSWALYAESLKNEKSFISLKCDSIFKFQSNKCKNNEQIPMGFAAPFGTKGSYYLETNGKKPFGRGIDGVNPKSKSIFG